MRRGVLACLAAGAIWGGIFLGPRVLQQYDALTFSLARYLIFGILSCALLYGFLLEARAPRVLEMIAIVCLVGGATWAMRVHAPDGFPPPGSGSR